MSKQENKDRKKKTVSVKSEENAESSPIGYFRRTRSLPATIAKLLAPLQQLQSVLSSSESENIDELSLYGSLSNGVIPEAWLDYSLETLDNHHVNPDPDPELINEIEK